MQSRLYKIIETIDNESGQRWERNPFMRFDSIGETITEIGEGGKYNVADIQKVFKQYGREISDDTAMEVKQLLYDVTQMPVNIFEAKPQRVVSFDEAKVFVVPNGVDVKLKQELLLCAKAGVLLFLKLLPVVQKADYTKHPSKNELRCFFCKKEYNLFMTYYLPNARSIEAIS